MKKIILNPLTMAAFGVAVGASAQLVEHTHHSLASISSVFMLWMVLCVTISLLSDSQRHAAILVGAFCIALVPSFYFTGYLLLPANEQFELKGFMIGWMIFALLTPIIAIAACHTRGSGLTPTLFRPLMIAVPIGVKFFIFHNLTMVDILLAGVLIYLLFVKKLGRVFDI